jgi:hypothetical protein
MAKQTMQDYELFITNNVTNYNGSQAIAVTANTAGYSEIDLGATKMGEGVAIKGVINVTALAGTMKVIIGSKTSASVASTDNPVTLTTISATGQYYFTLPQDVARYVNLFFTCVTSATVTAWLSAETRG